MKKSEFVDTIHEQTGVSKRTVSKVLSAFNQSLREALLMGESVNIRGVGTFSTYKRKPMVRRNLRTKELYEVPVTNQLRFQPLSKFKNDLKQVDLPEKE